ncbi:hypothetical protein [Haloferula sargassicola]|uniref:Uncharacterized protein n=1 Tax=Haloferula sargassicola TaxID=490096 RepID=A0ABP9UZ18_9BACT
MRAILSLFLSLHGVLLAGPALLAQVLIVSVGVATPWHQAPGVLHALYLLVGYPLAILLQAFGHLMIRFANPMAQEGARAFPCEKPVLWFIVSNLKVSILAFTAGAFLRLMISLTLPGEGIPWLLALLCLILIVVSARAAFLIDRIIDSLENSAAWGLTDWT